MMVVYPNNNGHGIQLLKKKPCLLKKANILIPDQYREITRRVCANQRQATNSQHKMHSMTNICKNVQLI